MTDLTLPNGNPLTLEYARLFKETDLLGRTIKEDRNWANNPATNHAPSTQS
ncbi:hypothetical protein [Pseudomonas viridiflava]|uniref:hypothetical protein n=1 Tax=Pseudomonas viridiflava TaxID=33069 RepID=UPI0013CE5B99|nr:hypothetical protein [Pseudomonas viridiflava]MEE4233820.1 hypothetical protein [Pseudomonas viridiflava]